MLLVQPQATRSVRPNITAGMPTYAMPAALIDPPHRCTSYQHETASKAMCGSLASSGLPVAVVVPLATQLLLPVAPSGSPAAVPIGCVPERDFGYESGGKMLSSSHSHCRNAR